MESVPKSPFSAQIHQLLVVRELGLAPRDQVRPSTDQLVNFVGWGLEPDERRCGVTLEMRREGDIVKHVVQELVVFVPSIEVKPTFVLVGILRRNVSNDLSGSSRVGAGVVPSLTDANLSLRNWFSRRYGFSFPCSHLK